MSHSTETHATGTYLLPGHFRPFPTEQLPESLANLVREAAAATVCDETYFALPMLAVCASSIGTTRRIQIKNKWCEPSVAWSVVVAPSGTQKSAGPELAAEPLSVRQRDAFKANEDELVRYAEQLLRYEDELRRWRENRGGGTAPSRPVEPQPHRFLVQDVTVEALAPILKQNPRGILVYRDELAGWLKGFDAYRSGRGGDAAHWLEMFGARSLTVDRKGGEPKTIHVPRAAVSITGTIQPGVLEAALGREQFESGLSARLLLAMPPRRMKQWTDADTNDETIARYTTVIERLLSLRHSHDSENAPKPIDLPLTSGGREAFIAFYGEHARRQVETASADVSAAFAKLEGYAARFALIFHCIREVEKGTTVEPSTGIDEESIRRGVALARWFAEETERIYGIFSGTERQRLIRAELEFIEAQGGTVSLRQFQRAYQTRYPTAEAARTALGVLEREGRGVVFETQTGGRPSTCFRLLGRNDNDKCTPD